MKITFYARKTRGDSEEGRSWERKQKIMAINENLLVRKVGEKQRLKKRIPFVQIKETMRILFEELYPHRAEDILDLIKEHKPKWEESKPKK